MKKLIIAIVLLIALLAGSVYAEGELQLDDATIKVNGDKERTANENGGQIEASPGSEIEIELKLKNTYDRDLDIDIDDIDVLGTIFDIDDGDDIEEEADEFDLDAGDSKRITLNFQLPYKVEDDIFELLVQIEARDDNGTDHLIEVEYDLKIKKERHKLMFSNIELSPSILECKRLSELRFEIINIGRENEDETTIEVTIPALEYKFTDNFDFDNDPDDDNIEYKKRLNIDLIDARPGIYEIKIMVTYDGGNQLLERKTLTIGECAALNPEKETEETEEEPKTTYVEKSEPKNPATTQVVFQNSESTPKNYATPAEQKGFLEENSWILIIIGADFLLVIIGILAFMAFRKK